VPKNRAQILQLSEAIDQKKLDREWTNRKAPAGFRDGEHSLYGKGATNDFSYKKSQGRFPANLIHDGSNKVVQLFPNSKGQQGDVKGTEPTKKSTKNVYGELIRSPNSKRNDSGSAARFFYCAKASKSERNMGLEELKKKEENLQGLDTRGRTLIREDGSKTLVERWKGSPSVNNHPTVKPIKLMEYLVKLVTPPEGLLLDPFAGSGSTLIACKRLNHNYIGIELDPDYCKIAYERIKNFKST